MYACRPPPNHPACEASAVAAAMLINNNAYKSIIHSEVAAGYYYWLITCLVRLSTFDPRFPPMAIRRHILTPKLVPIHGTAGGALPVRHHRPRAQPAHYPGAIMYMDLGVRFQNVNGHTQSPTHKKEALGETLGQQVQLCYDGSFPLEYAPTFLSSSLRGVSGSSLLSIQICPGVDSPSIDHFIHIFRVYSRTAASPSPSPTSPWTIRASAGTTTTRTSTGR